MPPMQTLIPELAASPDEFNEQLSRLRKWARKHEKGSQKAQHILAAALWKQLRKADCKPKCCGKPPHKLCSSCPQRALAKPDKLPAWEELPKH